jgi:hypothetical protein
MNHDELRNKVLGLEPYPENLKEKIREKISLTKERPLKACEKPLMAVSSVALATVFLGAIWATIEFELISRKPMYILIAGVMFLLFLVSGIVWLLIVLKKGTVRLRDEAFCVHGAAVITLYLAVAAMFLDKPMDGANLAGLIIVGVLVVVKHIDAAELRLRKRALLNELALVELSELIRRRGAEDSRQD